MVKFQYPPPSASLSELLQSSSISSTSTNFPLPAIGPSARLHSFIHSFVLSPNPTPIVCFNRSTPSLCLGPFFLSCSVFFSFCALDFFAFLGHIRDYPSVSDNSYTSPSSVSYSSEYSGARFALRDVWIPRNPCTSNSTNSPAAICVAVEKDREIRQIDVEPSYLYGDIDEEMYAE